AERVGVPEQLVAAAHAEHHGPARRRRVQRLALALDQVLRTQALVAVLAAAEVEQVMPIRVQRISQAAGGKLEAEAAPMAEALQLDHAAFALPLQAASCPSLLARAAGGRLEDATLALDHDLRPADGHARGLARVEKPVDQRRLRHRSLLASGARKRLQAREH